MIHAREFPLSVRPFSNRAHLLRNVLDPFASWFHPEISPETNHVRGRKEPRHLRHRLRGSSRSLLAAFLSLFYLGFWPGKAVTSSNCRLAAQYDDGAFFPLDPSKPEFHVQIALVRKSSVGRSLQVKGLRMCSVLLSAFGGPST